MKSIIMTSAAAILLSVCLFGCKKSNNGSGCKYDAIPSSLLIKLIKSGVEIPTEVITGTKLGYYDGNYKKYLTDLRMSIDTVDKHVCYISTRLIGILSGDNNIKTYYLEYPNGWATDTLYVDYLTHTPATNCLYIQNPVKCNGRLLQKDSSFPSDPPVVYIINKP